MSNKNFQIKFDFCLIRKDFKHGQSVFVTTHNIHWFVLFGFIKITACFRFFVWFSGRKKMFFFIVWFLGKTRENAFWRMEWGKLLPYSEKPNKPLQSNKVKIQERPKFIEHWKIFYPVLAIKCQSIKPAKKYTTFDNHLHGEERLL